MRAPISITTIPALPLLNQHVLVVDSTRGLVQDRSNAAAAQIPGTFRGRWTGARLTGTILCATQNVTAKFEELTDSAGIIAASFETDASGPGAGSATCTAGTTYQFSWLPNCPDWRIRILAGATAPSDLDVTCVVTWDRASGV